MSAEWDGVAAQLRSELAERRAQIASDRAAVLANPDLAARLTQPPLGYARAEQWNGFIPPDTWNGARNDSPRRTALLEIIEEATSA